MNKGNATIITIIGICILAAVVIYVYSHSKNNKQEATEQATEANEGYVFDVEDLENNIKDEAQQAQQDEVATVQTSQKVVENTTTNNKIQYNNASPDTGPGSIALVIATISATLFALFVYKRQKSAL